MAGAVVKASAVSRSREFYSREFNTELKRGIWRGISPQGTLKLYSPCVICSALYHPQTLSTSSVYTGRLQTHFVYCTAAACTALSLISGCSCVGASMPHWEHAAGIPSS